VHSLRAELLHQAARFAESNPPTDARILGRALNGRAMRRAAEDELRACARLAVADEERIRWVDQANAVRPVTWV
jgi:hypothetical protein